MIKVIPTTDWDRENRPKNFSSILSDDQWFSMCNELGDLNDRQGEGWCITEVLGFLPQISLSGDWQFATINEYQKIFDHLESIEG